MAKKSKLPARSIEERENRMISLAMDLAEKQLLEGTASSQVISHYLKQGSVREKYERERLQQENELLRTKVDVLKSEKRRESFYKEVIDAFRSYAPSSSEDDHEY